MTPEDLHAIEQKLDEIRSKLHEHGKKFTAAALDYLIAKGRELIEKLEAIKNRHSKSK